MLDWCPVRGLGRSQPHGSQGAKALTGPSLVQHGLWLVLEPWKERVKPATQHTLKQPSCQATYLAWFMQMILVRTLAGRFNIRCTYRATSTRMSYWGNLSFLLISKFSKSLKFLSTRLWVMNRYVRNSQCCVSRGHISLLYRHNIELSMRS